MNRRILAVLTMMFLSIGAVAQNKRKADDQVVRISTELVQVDVVVTDKNGRVVRSLSKDDFTLLDKGKKQLISFFEFVDVGKAEKPASDKTKPQSAAANVSPENLGEADIRRVFGFVIDDLTIRYEDLTYLHQMLTNFVDNQMQPTDLVAIVRTVSGKGLLQQFTTNKDLLRRAISSLAIGSHPLRVFNNPQPQRVTAADVQPAGGGGGSADFSGIVDTSGESVDIDDPQEDTNKLLRAFMSIGTASFVIDGLKQLPGRKSLVLISGGIPILSARPNTASSNISNFLNQLADKATRAGVAIHTLDIRGMQAHAGVAAFDDTPGKSAMTGGGGGFGRVPDESLLGYKNPFDTMEAQQGLRVLSSSTGGIAVLNRNDFNAALGQIVETSEGYYLLAYTPSDAKFDGDFHKLEIKVKGDYKVYSRRGYFAREDKSDAAPATRQEQVLAAVKAPLARREIDLDATVLYKAAPPPNQGAIDINLVIDPKKLQFDEQNGKREANLDVDGFVFDELGKLRGGFSETVSPSLLPDDYKRAAETGFTYSANTTLPPGVYQIRLAVLDNKTQKIGTLSRYLEVPDLTKGRLGASSVLLGGVPAKDMKATAPTPISGNRRISRKQDLRYALVIYNAKQKDSKPQVTTQLVISQNGQQIFKEAEEVVAATQNGSGQLIKVGQLGLSGVKPGRYTMTLIITDPLADKKTQTITRSMDFIVVN